MQSALVNQLEEAQMHSTISVLSIWKIENMTTKTAKDTAIGNKSGKIVKVALFDSYRFVC